MQKQWNEAIYLYNQLEKNYLPEEEFYNNRAIALINIGKLNEALYDLNKAIEINPANNDALNNKKRLLKILGHNN